MPITYSFPEGLRRLSLHLKHQPQKQPCLHLLNVSWCSPVKISFILVNITPCPCLIQGIRMPDYFSTWSKSSSNVLNEERRERAAHSPNPLSMATLLLWFLTQAFATFSGAQLGEQTRLPKQTPSLVYWTLPLDVLISVSLYLQMALSLININIPDPVIILLIHSNRLNLWNASMLFGSSVPWNWDTEFASWITEAEQGKWQKSCYKLI